MPAPESVVLETNLGNIQLELYWDHAPRVCLLSSISCASKAHRIFDWQTCENFAQLAKRGYYNGVVFHRIIAVCPLSNLLDSYLLFLKDFMVQGGDPTGTGKGGTSIYGQKLYVAHQFVSPRTTAQTAHFIPAKTRSIQNYGSRVLESSQWPTQGLTPTVRSFVRSCHDSNLLLAPPPP
jgi:hypothetical protein